MSVGGQRDAEEAPRIARMSVFVLAVIGLWVIFAPWVAPRLLLWEQVTSALGGEGVLLRVLLGILFLYFATLTHEKYALKRLARDIMEAFNLVMFGENYRQHRQTVAEQIELLRSSRPDARRSAHEVLQELTGQSLPEDHGAWEAWWSGAQSTFRLRGVEAPRKERVG